MTENVATENGLFEKELNRLGEIMHLPGIIVVDSSFLNGSSFLRHRVGASGNDLKLLENFYSWVFDELIPNSLDADLEIGFPHATREEIEKYISVKKRKLARWKESGRAASEIEGLEKVVDSMEAFSAITRIMPSEAYIGRGLVQYHDALKAAMVEVSNREGIVQNHLHEPSHEHLEHDAEVMANALAIALTPGPDVKTKKKRIYVPTRDGDLARMKRELTRRDIGLAYLSSKYGFPYSEDLAGRVRVVHERAKNSKYGASRGS